MRRHQALLLISTAASCVNAADSPPKGVGPDFVSFYKPSSGSFQCISSPSVQIKYDQVNDDFCDCPDGSDEPGTSACAHLSSLSPHDPSSNVSEKPALPGFYCQNIGHNPSYIPFTYVNDGVCDYQLCCDGSDEYKQVGNTKCQNKCKEIGEQWKKQDAARQKSQDNALKKRQDLVAQAAKRRLEITDEIAGLKTQITAMDIKVHKLTREKAEVERREKKRAASGAVHIDKLTSLITTVKPKLQELKDALEAISDRRSAYTSRVTELEDMLEDLFKNYNPNFNDEGVKRVVKNYGEYKAKDHSDTDEESEEETKAYLLTVNDGINWEEFEAGDQAGADESDVFAIYDIRSYLPHSVQEWIADKYSEIFEMLVANGIIARSKSKSSTESKAVRDAEKRLSSATNDLSDMKKKIKDHEEDLKKDYGVNDVFRPLKGNCISMDSGEYTYEMCWLEKVTQKSKKGGASQDMGSFAKYDTIEVDEEMPSDGKGLGKGKRLALKFQNGAHCWNGPSRSTTVVLACHEQEEVWKVTEEEKCVYKMLVGTPAVCDEPGQERDSGHKVAGGKAPSVTEPEDDEGDEYGHDEL